MCRCWTSSTKGGCFTSSSITLRVRCSLKVHICCRRASWYELPWILRVYVRVSECVIARAHVCVHGWIFAENSKGVVQSRVVRILAAPASTRRSLCASIVTNTRRYNWLDESTFVCSVVYLMTRAVESFGLGCSGATWVVRAISY